MAFRRYGGDFSFRGDGSNSKIAFLGVIALIVSAFLSVFFGEPEIIIVGFLLLFFFTAISAFVPGGATEGIREERHAFHIDSALESYRAGEYEKARESFEKAKIYDVLPKEHQKIYKELGVKT